MKRICLALLPWMAIAATAAAQQRTATAVFAYLDSARMDAVRVSDECYIPLDRVGELGWTFTLGKGTADLRAENKVLRVQLRQVKGETMFPLSAIAAGLGASLEWDGDLCRVFSWITSIKSGPGEFEVRTSIPVRTKLKGESQRTFELLGARLSPTVEITGDSQAIMKTKEGVEIAVDSSLPLTDDRVADDRGTLFRLKFQTEQSVTPIVEPEVEPVVLPTATSLPPTAKAGPLRVDIESDLAAVIMIPVQGKLRASATFRRPEPNQIEIILPGAEVLPLPEPLKTSSVTDVTTRTEGEVSVVTLTLARPMGLELSSNARAITLQLLKPRVGDGKLAGKTIVVDAGHGGSDGGARGRDGTLEKNLTLSVSKLVATELAKNGATVIMTRKEDVFIPLSERPAIANRNQANLFVSVHINSSAVANKTSGTISFYHRKDPIGELLAECIHRELAKVTGIPSIGIWSDSRIYKTGFAVLRGAKMPGVLLELGFINHDKDRARMKTPAFQKSVAEAVVRGIRNYLGDNEG